GISPFSASPRKHKRHRPNLRRNPRGRPQIEQRLRCWVENLGFLFVLAIFAVVAILSFGLAISSQQSALSQNSIPLNSLITVSRLPPSFKSNFLSSTCLRLRCILLWLNADC